MKKEKLKEIVAWFLIGSMFLMSLSVYIKDVKFTFNGIFVACQSALFVTIIMTGAVFWIFDKKDEE